jgi:hypothetical protein
MFRCLLSIICTYAFAGACLAEESITVTVAGMLKTGVVAIGGETTGTTITAREITWELNFGKNEELRKAAEKWNGQQVTVTGSLERRAGVEVKQRWIVTVTSLKGPEEPKKEEPKLGDVRLPTIRPESTRLGTSVVVAVEGDRTVIDIRCERGIDRCIVHREGDEWPKQVVACLQLKGLESFQARNGDVTLEWSVSSSEFPSSACVLTTDARSTRLTKDSAYFTTVKTLAPGGKPKIPLENGCFVVPLPAKFFEKNPTQITLQWVDFYR